MKSFFKLTTFIAALGLCATLIFGFASCSNGSDGNGALLAVTSGGGTTQTNGGTSSPTTETPTTPTNPTTPTETSTPVPVSYTVTFNANDGSENPATDTQTFAEGVPHALKAISALGFSKGGFNFAGWGTSADASQAVYADGSSYTATANTTLYALWSSVPVYSVNIPFNANGSVMATPATAMAGTDIILANTANAGYKFNSYTVIADGGTSITVTDGKFTMPAKNVTVTATFNAINYTVTCGTSTNGSVSVSPATATVGQTVTLTVTPASGFDLDTLTVTVAGGTFVPLSGTGNTWTFEMPATNVTVTVVFVAHIPVSGNYTNVGNNLVTFGLWPQTIKAGSVTVDESVTELHGVFTYCKGSDGEWYVKQTEKTSRQGLEYSDGTAVEVFTVGSYKWFKVEPIKWRILTTNYGGKKLLLAENALTYLQYYLDSTKSRDIGGKTIYPNNYKYSTIRAYLNGSYENGDPQSKAHLGKGFLQSAFTDEQQAAIPATIVDNSARSANPDKLPTLYENGYVSDTPTNDKIFLLSLQEVTTSAYGFDEDFLKEGEGNARIRHPTDFALATGAAYSKIDEWSGCKWWLRSPYYGENYQAFCVNWRGYAISYRSVGLTSFIGVVPALCVEN